MFSKLGSWFAIHDDEMDEIEGYDADQAVPKRNVVPLTEAGRRVGPSVAVFAPRGFSDVTEIADALRARQVAIVNSLKRSTS
jgi:FtsZ-interacting cell division protein YlmF